MKPILFEANETRFVSNGMGRIDAISCVVTEERNGQYELEMEVSIDDPHYGDIREGRILLVRHDDTTDKQPFDIYHISRPLNGVVTVLAQHISYRTATIVVAPFEASGIGLTLVEIGNHAIGDNPFTFWTNKTTTGTFSLDIPKTMRSMLAGEEGSLLDVFGTGEYEWDRFNIKLHLHRGVDSGVVIRYGKDLTALEKTTDLTNVWTGVAPYWRGAIDGSAGSEITVMLPNNGYVAAANEGSFPHKRIIPLDLSEEFYEIPTQAELREAAEQYVANNARTGIPTTIEFSFVNLAAYEEYENVAALQRLKLCDTVTVVYDRLGVRNTAKIIQTQYDVLQEKYISMTVGDVAPNLSTALTGGLREDIDGLKKNTRGMRSAIEARIERVVQEQTDLILGGTGGHVVHRLDGNGKPSEILIMNTDNVNTATQVLRLNVNGIGFSSTGVGGTYNTAWTLDGVFNANYITAGQLDASLIQVGTLTDALGRNYWNLETGDFQLAGVSRIYYGTYRTGASGSYTPSGSDVALANGDMRYDNTVPPAKTYIYDGSASTVWQEFSGETGDYLVDKHSGCTYRWDGSKWDVVTDYKSDIATLDSSLDSQGVFNRLTNNGAIHGIYMQNGQLYVNANYIRSGTLTLGGANNANGSLFIRDGNGDLVGWWDKDGISVYAGDIDIGGGKFTVDINGNLSASGAAIEGTFEASYDPFTGDIPPDAADYKQKITFDGDGFRYHTGSNVSVRLYENIYYEAANLRIVDNGFVIEDMRSNGLVLKSGKSVTIDANKLVNKTGEFIIEDVNASGLRLKSGARVTIDANALYVKNTEGKTTQVTINSEYNGLQQTHKFNFVNGIFIGMS